MFSLLASFFVSSTALIIKYSNGKYDLGEEYIDSNQNNQWDENESFKDQHNYYFPIIKKCLKILIMKHHFLDRILLRVKKDMASLIIDYLKSFQNIDNGNYVIMPLYPYDPYEEVVSELDEDFTDLNNNKIWDKGEPLVDNNNNGLREIHTDHQQCQMIIILWGQITKAEMFYQD